MSNRVSRRALKSAVAIAGVLVGAVALSGCTALGSRSFGDSTVTGSTGQSTPSNMNQPMPSSLGAPPMQVAANQFVPPANVGGFGGFQQPQQGFNQPVYSAPIASGTGAMPPSVSSQDLPVLSSTSPMGTQQAMSAQQTLAPVAAMPPAAALGSLPPAATAPNLVAVPANAYAHTIASGESLYTIARRYDVTTQAIVQANGMSSPDKIVVGQKVIIPGRADLLATKAPAATQVAAAPAAAPLGQLSAPAGNAVQAATATPAPAPAPVAAAPVAAPTQVANVPAAEPVMSGNDKFRWPVSGRVITDFASSKGTGINIEAAEGATIKAAENGTVIYVGSGVEGYGNLVLIRHPNGYVSAYAHLKSMSVSKGSVVGRGDTIGAAGMTGSVTKPQLHFELRKGATPVDPMPLLAS
ncbi:M23 family metallopeptidase [Devosia limi]|uniref:Murein DD-endopeptidase MepM and murein hydrolase activator NlpD, contain LysM domain n=1 Tax=Devosia limi DSM 17137 TaxID=1121477 RepID=A0A1M4VQU8_9HYPH|nr:M23 family metallopeptidase [Devosia limi]SHE71481.1 Murein DD-endopeptidase MepM and murein hydrolase activator NlpD, contain LysM domain [Devosia limi DSM 17137]